MKTIDNLIKDKEEAERRIAVIMQNLRNEYPKGDFRLYDFVEEKSEVEGITSYESQVKIIVEL